MANTNLRLTSGSINEVLRDHKGNPFKCLCEYIWNAFDANANCVELNFRTPPQGIGYVDDVSISDDGAGWDFDDEIITNNFMASLKKPSKEHSLPRGQSGKGRYAFIWLCEYIDIYSGEKKMTLNRSVEIQKTASDSFVNGTKVCFKGVKEPFSTLLLQDNFTDLLIGEFGWLIHQNSSKKILINGTPLDVSTWIDASSCVLTAESFPDEIKDQLGTGFEARIVIWKNKPEEYSRFYFINTDGIEVSKRTTGFNKKRDDFWHSVYIRSEIFSSSDGNLESEDDQPVLNLGDAQQAKLKNKVLKIIRQKLTEIRKPQLVRSSEDLYSDLKSKHLIPELSKFGIYDEQSFERLIKDIYILSPSLFTNRSEDQKSFLCASFAGLLSSQDNSLLKLVLEQIIDLTDEEKRDLEDILNRTHLSNIVRLTKEVDKRLEVIDKLKCLLSEHKETTLEVKHIQRILDENFWIFGEQFRLFSSTEGALNRVLERYAKEVLGIDNAKLEDKPMGELDLFLTKTESQGERCQRNVVVELKRASIKLGKKEYDQIEKYKDDIIKQSLCNGTNQYWEFYLVGSDYDDHIGDKIESAKTWGEENRGLCSCTKDGRVKLYVRKWSDILQVEWESKMKYLKEKLCIKPKSILDGPDNIVKDLIYNGSKK